MADMRSLLRIVEGWEKTKTNMPQRMTSGRYSDNPMKDAAGQEFRNTSPRYADNPLKEDNEFPQYPQETLDTLRGLLNSIGVEDDRIARGVELQPSGYAKIAGTMGIHQKDVVRMIAFLRTDLQDDEEQLDESEDPRFTYEKDIIGNVTVRDTITGKEEYIQGEPASQLLNRLKSGTDEQQLLSLYFKDEPHELHEDDNLFSPSDDNFEDEINSKSGSYNFPWNIGDEHGTATATYTDDGKIKVVSLRDEEGHELQMDPAIKDQILQQAISFISEV
jgi:hypothetical protein